MKIEVLFPEICNLYGDLENIKYLEKCSKEIEIVSTSLKEEPYFVKNTPAMVYIGSMSEKSQEIVIEILKKHITRIEELIDENVIFFATGNAMEIFGERIENEDGSIVECLGISSTIAKRRMFNRFNSLYLGHFGDIEIVGFKSQFTHSYGNHMPLFITDKGVGLNPEDKGEGIRKGGLMGTYVLGPIFILNPLFTKKILAEIGVERPSLAFERAIMESYKVRLSEFKEPNRGFYY